MLEKETVDSRRSHGRAAGYIKQHCKAARLQRYNANRSHDDEGKESNEFAAEVANQHRTGVREWTVPWYLHGALLGESNCPSRGAESRNGPNPNATL